MNKILLSIFAIIALAVTAQAQSAPVILTVDVEKIFRDSSRIQDALGGLNREAQNAATEVNKMQEQREQLMQQAVAEQTKANNPALTPEAKTSATEKFQNLANQIGELEQKMMQFQQSTQQELRSRRDSIVGTYFEQIRQAVIEVAERKNATLVLNNNQMVLYASDALDITAEVSALLTPGR